MNEDEIQRKLRELDRVYLASKEKECHVRAQLQECNTQQGVLGLKIINLDMESELLAHQIEDLQRERGKIYSMMHQAREEQASAKWKKAKKVRK